MKHPNVGHPRTNSEDCVGGKVKKKNKNKNATIYSFLKFNKEERADLDFTHVHGTNLKYVEQDSSGPQFPYLHNELSIDP